MADKITVVAVQSVSSGTLIHYRTMHTSKKGRRYWRVRKVRTY